MVRVKIIVLRIIVFFLVFAGVVAIIVYFTSERPFYGAHDAGADIQVWMDTNGNGKREDTEPFLPNVCVWAGYASSFQSLADWKGICNNPYFLTDSNGAWSEFFPGGTCPEIYNIINPPENYLPTTPTIVNGCFAEFGLSQVKPIIEIKSQDASQFLQQENRKEIMIYRIKVGIVILLISIFAGFVSFKTISSEQTKAG